VGLLQGCKFDEALVRTLASARVRIWALLLGSSLLYFFTINEADNDLWGHVLFGRDILAAGAVPRVDPYSYTVAGQPWFDHEWLAQVTMAGAYEHAGSAGLLILKFALATFTCALLFALMRRRTAVPEILGGLGMLAIAVLARGFAVRPQIFTYCSVALTLWLIDRYQHGRPRALWAFPAVFVVWVNLHGGFVLGLAILGLFVAAECLRTRALVVQPLLVWSVSAAMTTLNPYGPALLGYIRSELSRPHLITEWQPVAAGDVSQLVFFGMAGLFVVTLPFFRDWRTSAWQPVLALISGGLALRAQRHTPVFALCAITPLAAQLDEAVRWVTRRSIFVLSAASQRVIAAAIVGVAALQLVLTGLRWHRDGPQVVFDRAEYPVGAVQALRRAGIHGNLVVPLDWGEYVLWHLAPGVKVSLDGRFATVYPDMLVYLNSGFFTGATGWRRMIDDYPTDLALVPSGTLSPITRLSNWERVYGDDVAEIYARTDRPVPMVLTREPAGVPGVFP
jgi:hypothetical protein